MSFQLVTKTSLTDHAIFWYCKTYDLELSMLSLSPEEIMLL